MLPQPPADAPAPSPSEEALQSRRWWKWLWIVSLLPIVILLAWPLFVRSRKRTVCDITEDINNARRIGIVLFEFHEEYGSYPDITTIAAVQSKTGTHLALGDKTSNDFFRQLLAAGMTKSESMFYFKTKGIHRPDGKIDGASALAKSECGFTYFLGATKDTNPSRPLVVAPMH